MQKIRLRIFTDGACSGNHQLNLAKRSGGIGVYCPTREAYNLSEKFTKGLVTNQRCEVYAIYRGILNVSPFLDSLPGRHELEVLTDNKYSLHICTKKFQEWKEDHTDLPAKNRDLIKPLFELLEEYDDRITFGHVYAHRKQPESQDTEEYAQWDGNRKADLFAKRGAKLPGIN